MKIENLTQKKSRQRAARKERVRKKISGTSACPRLSVFRSNRYIYAQLIDDTAGITLAAASTLVKADAKATKSTKNIDAASVLGQQIGEVAKQLNIRQVVFDKGWYRYHGKIRAFAEAVRATGLTF